MTVLLSVQGLTKGFGPRPLFTDLSLDLRAGERVGFTDPDQPADALSGGWRKRLGLARELARRPDLLLLDEPTNHLDLPGIIWLERLLREAPFGYLVATHDRAFLRAVADEVIEI